LPSISDCALENFHKCVNDVTNYIPVGVKKYTHSWVENARGLCSCGKEVELWDEYHGACKCSNCGQWYNLMGQSLLPPECWQDDVHDEYDD